VHHLFRLDLTRRGTSGNPQRIVTRRKVAIPGEPENSDLRPKPERMARRPETRFERRAAHDGGHLRPASASRFDDAARAQHIGQRRPQPLRIVVE